MPNKQSIEKYQLIFNEHGISVGVALRKGDVDLYYDGVLAQQNGKGYCIPYILTIEKLFFTYDVELSFDDVFIRTSASQNEPATLTQSVSHDLKSRMSTSEAKKLEESYDMKKVFYQRVKSHCKIFSGFVFLKTYIFVAHGHLLSLYDMKS